MCYFDYGEGNTEPEVISRDDGEEEESFRNSHRNDIQCSHRNDIQCSHRNDTQRREPLNRDRIGGYKVRVEATVIVRETFIVTV